MFTAGLTLILAGQALVAVCGTGYDDAGRIWHQESPDSQVIYGYDGQGATDRGGLYGGQSAGG